MKLQFKHILSICLVPFILSCLIGQNSIRWYTECQKEVYESSTFEVSFTLTNAEGKNVKFPTFEGFDVLSGPAINRSMTIIKGSRSGSSGFSFVLQSKKTGNYIIGPATIEANGKIYKSEAVNIAVIKSNLQTKELPSGDLAAIAKLKVTPIKAYVGQQIMAQYVIYYGENIAFSEEPLKPNYDGFFVKDLKVAQATMSGLKVGNKQFEGILVDAVALYPQKAGIVKIEPTTFTIQKRIPGSNPFQNPFGSYVQKVLKTNDESIDVKALPQGAPSTFSGGVGEYKIECDINNSAFTTNQSIVLKLTVSGTGDSRQVGPPLQNFGQDFEVYPARSTEDEEFIANNVVWHKKVFEYLITPKKEGAFVLKPLFTFFDTRQEKFITLESITPTFTVKRESRTVSQFFSGTSQSEKHSDQFPKWPFFMIAPFLAFLVYWLWKKKSSNKPSLSNEEKLELRKKNAGQLALAKLGTAKQLMDESKYELFYKEIGFAINNYLQSKYTISTENLNKQYIHSFLSNKSKSPSIARDYSDIIEKAELSMYAGYSDKNVKDIFNNAKNFILTCELD
jgi:hypothetical protein